MKNKINLLNHLPSEKTKTRRDLLIEMTAGSTVLIDHKSLVTLLTVMGQAAVESAFGAISEPGVPGEPEQELQLQTSRNFIRFVLSGGFSQHNWLRMPGYHPSFYSGSPSEVINPIPAVHPKINFSHNVNKQLLTRMNPTTGAPEVHLRRHDVYGTTMYLPSIFDSTMIKGRASALDPIQTEPMKKILKNAMIFRGVDMGNGGHGDRQKFIERVSSGSPSMLGTIADNSFGKLIPAIMDSSFQSQDYRSNRNLNPILIHDMSNALSKVLSPFNNAGLGMHQNRRTTLKSVIDAAMSGLKTHFETTKPATDNFNSAYQSAQTLLEDGIANALALWAPCVEKYQRIIHDSKSLEAIPAGEQDPKFPLLIQRSAIPGVTTRAVPTTNKVLVLDHDNNPGTPNQPVGYPVHDHDGNPATPYQAVTPYFIDHDNNPSTPMILRPLDGRSSGFTGTDAVVHAYNPDLRSLIDSATHMNNTPRAMALAEILFVNLKHLNFTGALSLNLNSCSDLLTYNGFTPVGANDWNMTSSRQGWNTDEHTTGTFLSLVVTTWIQRAVSSCINELINKLSEADQMDKTVICFMSEFERTPAINGNGWDIHDNYGNVITLWSGLFPDAPQVTGNMFIETPVSNHIAYGPTHPGTWFSAPLPAIIGREGSMKYASVAASICTALAMPSPYADPSMIYAGSDGKYYVRFTGDNV